ncbi:MAG: hypothetical protein D6734_10435 [Candidatus Schekmanbacteria bacterium]|nr:MAG: hypothetical protein D6734_10435 [Candidatus Schekmanbacteria bacterium]
MTKIKQMDCRKFNEKLEFYLRPQSFPLAIKMLKAGDSIPDKTKVPLRDLNKRIAICQGISIARRYGWTIAMGEADINCPITKIVFGFEKASEKYYSGVACAGMYNASEKEGAKTEKECPKFEYGKYEKILVAPLFSGKFMPDIVCIYGNSAQVMRLLVASLYERGGYLHSKFCGRVDCADIVIETMKNKRCQVILPCYGDRVFAQTQDDEMAFSFPYDEAESICRGLEETHKAGIRYPIPNYLRYEGEFPEKYKAVMNDWEKS